MLANKYNLGFEKVDKMPPCRAEIIEYVFPVFPQEDKRNVQRLVDYERIEALYQDSVKYNPFYI